VLSMRFELNLYVQCRSSSNLIPPMLPSHLHLNTVLYQKDKQTNLEKLNHTVLFSIWEELDRTEKYSLFVSFTLQRGNIILL